MSTVLGAAAVATAAVAVGWPMRSTRVRQRALGMSTRGRPAFVRIVPSRLVMVAAVLTGTTAWLVAGPVAAVIVATYGGLAWRAVWRRTQRRAAAAARARALDDLAETAADVRAGLPVPHVSIVDRQDMLAGRVAAAVALAESTGAPVADLLDRIEADARAADRAAAVAAAQSAGARVTAWLLGALPAAGIALGYGVGADPLDALLHTELGAACAVAALVLQLAGLAWVNRLMETR
jgi:tight adherence protein B